ncbi:FkbM family methyltransferase [Azorhizobium sp. AG788]|uniref:FkbM family methyltransferase n=1 Tax=Azorhizobium sp. AG788 TaxID=2183897 RepID=UPI003139AF85
MTVFADDSRFIIDLGMNNGDDTAFYLAKGYNVVAVEANPKLVAAARTRFAKAIEAHRLTILENAIWETPGPVKFFINDDNDHWSSVDIGWAGREQSNCRPLEVEAITLNQIFDRFGTPLFLKIDVEGVDQMVLNQLAGQIIKPLYVSVEDCRFGFDYIETLAHCGYDGFKLLDQSTVPTLRDDLLGHCFPKGSSGPFGKDVPGHWLDKDEIIKLYATTVRDRTGRRLAPRTQWWDIHAAKL